MPTLKEYNNLKELRRAIAQKQVDTESLLDWESDRKLSKWLEEKGETDKARLLVKEYDISIDNLSLILEVLSFPKEEIKKIIAGKDIDNSSHNTGNMTLEELSRKVDLLEKHLYGLNDFKMPVGTISLFPVESIPCGWLPCEGQCLSISCFESLFARLGHTWGNNGKDNFFLPNLRQQACNSKLCYCIFTGEYKPLPPGAIKSLLQFIVNGVSFEMVFVEGGKFIMGATQEQGTEVENYERPMHQVSLSSYFIGQFQVTQALWQAIMQNNPSNFKGDTLPVENTNYNACNAFIQKLNELTGRCFRLPTEAEWEYAARGGRLSKGFKYSGSDDLSKVAWHGKNGERKTHPVGKKDPNELGIYDMSGNVNEWCYDYFDTYDSNQQTNPIGPSNNSDTNYRVIRGGCWFFGSNKCRVAYRQRSDPHFSSHYLGLRLVFVP